MERRHALGWLIAGSAGLLTPRGSLQAEAPGSTDAWLEAIASRKVRAFLDIRSYAPDGTPFRKVANLRTALIEAYHVKANEVGIAFGAGSSAIGHVLGESVWREYGVGAAVASHARSPEEAASLRNEPAKWAEIGAKGVQDVLGQGVRVLACRNSIGKWARDFAAQTGETPDAVNAKLIAGLLPGVEPVPAMIAAAVLAQSRRLSYVAIG
jgi:hypothetical protein